MSAFLSVHSVKQLAATTVQADGECAGHFTLNYEGETFENHGAVTFYIDDRVLNSRLIEAINAVVAARKAELANPLPSFEVALQDPAKARALFDASKGGAVRGITEDHRFALADVFQRETA